LIALRQRGIDICVARGYRLSGLGGG